MSFVCFSTSISKDFMTTDMVMACSHSTCDCGFYGDQDDGGAFEAGGKLTQLQRSVGDLHEDWGPAGQRRFSGRQDTPSGPGVNLSFYL